MVLMLYSINWPNYIIWFLLLLEILTKMCISIACSPGCDVINFEINLIFLIKPFLFIIRMPKQNLKYLENEKSFQGEIKSIFYHFLRAFSCQKLSQTWEYAFKDMESQLSFAVSLAYYWTAFWPQKFRDRLHSVKHKRNLCE